MTPCLCGGYPLVLAVVSAADFRKFAAPSTTEVMLAGNWRPARMVAHYSAGATAERGAVAKYLCRERLGPELGRWFTNR